MYTPVKPQCTHVLTVLYQSFWPLHPFLSLSQRYRLTGLYTINDNGVISIPTMPRVVPILLRLKSNPPVLSNKLTFEAKTYHSKTDKYSKYLGIHVMFHTMNGRGVITLYPKTCNNVNWEYSAVLKNILIFEVKRVTTGNTANTVLVYSYVKDFSTYSR